MNKNAENSNKKKIISLRLLFLIVIFLWLLSWFLIEIFINSNKIGSFGDMFGAINALFSGLAFVGVIYAIFLQMDELELQRNELELTRKDIKDQTVQFEAQEKQLGLQREELEIQNKTNNLQRFENTFFQLLKKIDLINNDLRSHYFAEESWNIGKEVLRKYKFLHFNDMSSDIITDSIELEELYNGFKTLIDDIGEYITQSENYIIFISEYIMNSNIEDKNMYRILLRDSFDPLVHRIHYCQRIRLTSISEKTNRVNDFLQIEEYLHKYLLNNEEKIMFKSL